MNIEDKIDQELRRHEERIAKIEQRKIDGVLTEEKAAQQVTDENERHAKNVAYIEK